MPRSAKRSVVARECAEVAQHDSNVGLPRWQSLETREPPWFRGMAHDLLLWRRTERS
jgi:hypothetical protein